MKYLLYILTLCLLAQSCKEVTETPTKGVVTSAEWYTSTIGFSRTGAKGYFKQNVIFRYAVEDSIYSSTFKNGPDLGVLEVGDSLTVSYEEENPENVKVTGRFRTTRKKFAPVKGTAGEKK